LFGVDTPLQKTGANAVAGRSACTIAQGFTLAINSGNGKASASEVPKSKPGTARERIEMHFCVFI
jgi:hypothetical protein